MRLGAALRLSALALTTCTASVNPAQRDAGAGGACDGVSCNEGFTCLDGACVPDDPCDGVECNDPDEQCSGGRCVSCEADQDGDGFEACVDCDDADPNVVPGSEAPCETACGSGTVRCLGLAGWSNCTAPLECDCDPGATRSEPCGRCGSLERACTAGGTWGEPGTCEEVGECVPGTVSTEACEEGCAERERECTAACRWGGWGDCRVQGDCTAGETETADCPEGGQHARTCGDDCAWGPWSECGTGECVPGATETQGCGLLCGTQSRTCDADGTWGAFGACGGEGACAPGSRDDRACGDCGTQSRTCDANCQWGDYAACAGEGACSPGATRDGNCDPCAHQVCNDNCNWGGCVLRPGSECEWQEGTHWRCCDTDSWQFCLPNSCVWSSACADCNGCGCP